MLIAEISGKHFCKVNILQIMVVGFEPKQIENGDNDINEDVTSLLVNPLWPINSDLFWQSSAEINYF